ncbi:MAG: MFS transporter, partial [Thalassotalea sp.]|nr:MFS transporter [Thalassotalea sp.]
MTEQAISSVDDASTVQDNKAVTPPVEVVPKKYLISFILITLCFPLWGFANDITNPLVKAFSKILQMSTAE